MIYLLSAIYVAATGVKTSPLIQWCQVSLPAGLAVNRDCRLGVLSTSDDDLLLARVRDSTCMPVEDKLLNCLSHLSRMASNIQYLK